MSFVSFYNSFTLTVSLSSFFFFSLFPLVFLISSSVSIHDRSASSSTPFSFLLPICSSFYSSYFFSSRFSSFFSSFFHLIPHHIFSPFFLFSTQASALPIPSRSQSPSSSFSSQSIHKVPHTSLTPHVTPHTAQEDKDPFILAGKAEYLLFKATADNLKGLKSVRAHAYLQFLIRTCVYVHLHFNKFFYIFHFYLLQVMTATFNFPFYFFCTHMNVLVLVPALNSTKSDKILHSLCTP